MKIKLELNWADTWIGACWKKKEIQYGGQIYPRRKEFHIWICVVPCLPIHIWWKMK